MSELYKPFQPLLTEEGRQKFELSVQQHPGEKLLRGKVHSYLQVSVAKPTPYPVIPDGTQAVFISSQSTRLSGALSKALEIQILQPGDYFGIRFYPGALRHFFSLNLSEITNQFVDSRYLSCNYFAELHNHIYEQHSFLERAKTCEQWLLRHINPLPPNSLDHALDLIYRSLGGVDIGKLAKTVGITSRHLNRLFQQYTGLSTKTFAQTIRIQNACQRLNKNPDNSLATAVELGFYDQAHLLKDYKQRLLMNPRSLFDRFTSDFYKS